MHSAIEELTHPGMEQTQAACLRLCRDETDASLKTQSAVFALWRRLKSAIYGQKQQVSEPLARRSGANTVQLSS